MASSLNSIIMMGRLAADPIVRHTPDGTAVANFDIAVNRKGKNEDNEVDFFTIVAWRQMAEFVEKYYHKGENVVVRGVLQNRKYTDRQGQKRKVAEIIADEIYFAGNRKPINQEPKTETISGNELFSDELSIGDFEALPSF